MFLSYRRNDTAHATRLIYQRLQPLVNSDKLFLDVSAIKAGEAFPQKISAAISKSKTMLVIIGPDWTGNVHGRRRIYDPNDHVTREVAQGLQKCRVIPVLVDGANMPTKAEIPESIHALLDRNYFKLRHETFESDLQRLFKSIFKGPLPKNQKFDDFAISIGMVVGFFVSSLSFLSFDSLRNLGLTWSAIVFFLIMVMTAYCIFRLIDMAANINSDE